jgi:K+ transporter
MILTALLYMAVIRYVWKLNWFFVAAFGVFVPFDLVMWAANLSKVPNGGVSSSCLLRR